MKRICRECGQPVLMRDLGETRHTFPSNKTTYLCKPCRDVILGREIAATRRRMGLNPLGEREEAAE